MIVSKIENHRGDDDEKRPSTMVGGLLSFRSFASLVLNTRIVMEV